MKVYFKGALIMGSIALVATGCGDLLGVGKEAVKKMDEIIIVNDTDVSQCESDYLPAHSNSAILYYSSDKTCSDFGRTEGDHCQVIQDSTDRVGDTTCVIGYDHQ